MATQVISLKCPGCGAPVSTDQSTCKYCKGPITITSFSSVCSMPMPEVNKYARSYQQTLAEHPDDTTIHTSIAMCYLKLKLYDKALASFEKALEDNFDNSETFFYAAVCLLKGKKAFLATRAVIDQAIEYIQAAQMIEPRGIYSYFLAYIRYDYFKRKHLTVHPNWEETLAEAQMYGVSEADIDQLYGVLCVERPKDL